VKLDFDHYILATAPVLSLRMILSENRYHPRIKFEGRLFGIMRQAQEKSIEQTNSQNSFTSLQG
jgi:hypothetical protein